MSEEIQLRKDLFTVNESSFTDLALRVFQFQYHNNILYQSFCKLCGKSPSIITIPEHIPFLPVSFFKSQKVKTASFGDDHFFESSGTTGSINSRHYIKDLSLYRESFLNTFKTFYGAPESYCIIGLLPSYLERSNSSLVYMVDALIKLSGNDKSGFYLYDHQKLADVLIENESAGKKTLLIGVTYALIDFANSFPIDLKHTIVMETGGMKGRKEEMTRTAVHELLSEKFNLKNIHSEYGMTELLSQAYAKEKGIFYCPNNMKVLLRAPDDPFDITMQTENAIRGAINIIDLANLFSCAFIATDDAGILYPDGSFEVSGRLDNSDIRGCGLMIV